MKKIGILFFALALGSSLSAAYTWNNVQIRGGGFVTGIVYSKLQSGLAYARTDVGGAFRWDSAQSVWIPLNDALGRNDSQLTGVLSLAVDPTNANKLYLACGQYTPTWASFGAVLRSSDQGATWVKTTLTIRLGGNEDGRNAGERLQVDPNLSSILFLGSSIDGLWKSTDSAVTWAKVAGFTPTSTTFVCIDKSSGASGSATPVLYVGVNATTNNLYKSINGGSAWALVAGAPTGYFPLRFAISGTNLYITYANVIGPNGATTGKLYRYATGTGVWTDLTPPTVGCTSGFCGVSVDEQNPNHIVVSTLDRWCIGDGIFRSTSGGSAGSWTDVLSGATINTSSAPYASYSTPHWIGCVEIDPFNSAKAMFETGYGLFATSNLGAAPTTFSFSSTGLEETVPLEIINPPSGAPVMSAIGDIDGFKHDNVTISPPSGRLNPRYGTNRSIAVAELLPTKMVRTYDTTPFGAYSTDGGSTWTAFAAAPGAITVGEPVDVALAADGSAILWNSVGSGMRYSTNNGTSWSNSSALVAGFKPIADKVNPSKFYAYDAVNGDVYVSTNKGVDFALAASTLPLVADYLLGDANLRTVFGIEGDIWLTASSGGLYHSTNSGTSFTKVANVTEAYQIGFGKVAPAQIYPALYLAGIVGGVDGLFRSDDAAATWVRINDSSHQFGWLNDMIGDENTYGRVYLATGGRGIIYGDSPPSGSPTYSPTITRTPSRTPTFSPSPTATPSPSRTATPDPCVAQSEDQAGLDAGVISSSWATSSVGLQTLDGVYVEGLKDSTGWWNTQDPPVGSGSITSVTLNVTWAYGLATGGVLDFDYCVSGANCTIGELGTPNGFGQTAAAGIFQTQTLILNPAGGWNWTKLINLTFQFTNPGSGTGVPTSKWVKIDKAWVTVNYLPACGSPTPSLTSTRTPSATPTATRTMSPSSTPSHSPTSSVTATPTRTVTTTLSASATGSSTTSPTRTETLTGSPTRTPTPTITATVTRTATPTRTPTITGTATITPSVTVTPNGTFTHTPTVSPTRTVTVTFSNTPSATLTASPTVSPSATPSITVTPTSSATFSPSPSPSPTWTRSATLTASQTRTATPTSSLTRTGTSTITATATRTATSTASPTISGTSTTSPTLTVTPNGTSTHSPTESPTRTVTTTFSNTPSATLTVSPSVSPSATPSITVTPTSSATFSPSPTPSSTGTRTVTLTASPTRTATQSFTDTPTLSSSPSPSATATASPSATPTPTATESFTPSPVVSETESPTTSPTASSTGTSSSTATLTHTVTVSDTPTHSPSPSSTETASETVSVTATITPSETGTPTQTDTLTASPTLTWTATPTFSVTRTSSSTITPTATLTRTPTTSPTASPTGTSSSTATVTMSPTRSATGTLTPLSMPLLSQTLTATPTATATSATPAFVSGGPLVIDSALVVPNPVIGNITTISVQMGGSADELRWSIYTAAMVKSLSSSQVGQISAGWHSLTIDVSGLPNGLFYIVVNAVKSGGEVSPRKLVRMMILR